VKRAKAVEFWARQATGGDEARGSAISEEKTKDHLMKRYLDGPKAADSVPPRIEARHEPFKAIGRRRYR
jgi:hypothetical protein